MKYLLCLVLCLVWPFTPSVESQMETCVEYFIKEAQYLTARQAVYESVPNFKDPAITVKRHVKSLTGRQLCDEANRIEKIDRDQPYMHFGPTTFKIIRQLDRFKKLGADHPDEVIAHKFYYEGMFSSYTGSRDKKTKYIVYASSINAYFVESSNEQ